MSMLDLPDREAPSSSLPAYLYLYLILTLMLDTLFNALCHGAAAERIRLYSCGLILFPFNFKRVMLRQPQRSRNPEYPFHRESGREMRKERKSTPPPKHQQQSGPFGQSSSRGPGLGGQGIHASTVCNDDDLKPLFETSDLRSQLRTSPSTNNCCVVPCSVSQRTCPIETDALLHSLGVSPFLEGPCSPSLLFLFPANGKAPGAST